LSPGLKKLPQLFFDLTLPVPDKIELEFLAERPPIMALYVALGVAGGSTAGLGCGGRGSLNIAGTFWRRSGMSLDCAVLFPSAVFASPLPAVFASLGIALACTERTLLFIYNTVRKYNS
jgi:hypothetical protein